MSRNKRGKGVLSTQRLQEIKQIAALDRSVSSSIARELVGHISALDAEIKRLKEAE